MSALDSIGTVAWVGIGIFLAPFVIFIIIIIILVIAGGAFIKSNATYTPASKSTKSSMANPMFNAYIPTRSWVSEMIVPASASKPAPAPARLIPPGVPQFNAQKGDPSRSKWNTDYVIPRE